MPVTGELIRLMNYVGDISAALRRIHSTIPTLSAEECQQLAVHMRNATPAYNDVLAKLEHGTKG